MVDVNVTVSGIIMCCDESVCNVNLGRGYTIGNEPSDRKFIVKEDIPKSNISCLKNPKQIDLLV